MAKIIQIGNSQGIRIPKPLIQLANLEDRELDFVVMGEDLLITSKKRPRVAWSTNKANIIKNSEWKW